MNALGLYAVTLVALTISFVADRNKTLMSVKAGLKRFADILPAFLFMLILVSIVLFLFPSEEIGDLLGKDNRFYGVLLASLLGSVTLVPGFVAFPLCGILLRQGVSYMVLSAFTTTLMMVGVITYPIEKEYFGNRVAIMRNVASFFITLAVAVATGIFFGEIF